MPHFTGIEGTFWGQMDGQTSFIESTLSKSRRNEKMNFDATALTWMPCHHILEPRCDPDL